MDYLPTFNQEDEQALIDSVIIQTNTHTVITHAYSYAHDMIKAEKDLVRLSKDEMLNPKRYSSIFSLIREEASIKHCFPLSEFSPYVALCFSGLNEIEKDTIRYNIYPERNQKDVFEKSVLEKFKAELKSESFRKTIDQKKKAVSKNKQSLLRYIKALFAYRSTLLVLRIDFGYPKTQGIYYLAPYSGKKIDLFYYPHSKNYFKRKRSLKLRGMAAREHRDLLIKQLNKKYKGNLVGYVWKLEYGEDKGFHFHMIFFLDGSKHQEDISIAQSIGELWKNDITHGHGVYWNCNASKKKFEKNNRIATGKIHYNDKEKRNNLERMATYLIKPDYFVKTVLPDGARTFGKGGKHEKEKSGRPRKGV